MRTLLLFSALVVAGCGLVYELVAGTLASYLLGDSVTQFSTVIGTYLFAMGVGAWLSRYVRDALVDNFVRIEIVVGIIGGSAAAILFLLFPEITHFRVALYGLVLVIGILVGLEIPILIRILKGEFELSELVARVLAADYLGALVASLLFPLVLMPRLGLIRTGFLFGILNVSVAWLLLLKPGRLRHLAAHRMAATVALVSLTAGFVYADDILSFSEQDLFPGQAIFTKSSQYQRIVVTRDAHDVRLFLNGNLQFNSRDEYRYHEALVHPALTRVRDPRRVLVLGGGDGLAVREVLKYPGVESVTLVDLDPEMTALFTGSDFLAELNSGALRSPKVRVVNADAFVWLQEQREVFDAIVVDFPDPSNYSIGKLYSVTFYRRLATALAPEGLAVVQSTSPLVAPQAYWCIDRTLQAAGFVTSAYHAMVPSFGEWGFVLAGRGALHPPAALPDGLRFLNPTVLAQMFSFPPDMQRVATEVNRLDNQVLVRYFETEWGSYLAE